MVTITPTPLDTERLMYVQFTTCVQGNDNKNTEPYSTPIILKIEIKFAFLHWQTYFSLPFPEIITIIINK